MRASSLTSRLKRGVMVQNWLWWRLPLLLRIYVAFVPVAAVAVIGIAAAYTDWRLSDVVKFLVFVACGMISIASTPKVMYTVGGGVTRDFSSIWVLPTAILLPPVYAALVAIPIVGALHIFVHRGIPHRMVFTAAGLSLSGVAASLAFRAFPVSFAGIAVGSGFHAFTWCLAVAACEILGGRVQHFMIVGAVKLANPKIRMFMAEFNRNNLQALFVEIDLGVLITLSVALSPALVVIALPTVLLVRRFLVFPILEAQSRIDSKTGLLNVSTWESEAESELSRAVRTGNPVALALVDIDHFKLVNDTYGHLAGDRVLKAIAQALTGQSRDYDRAGRFGGEEFVLLLAQTTWEDACNIAQRLRGYVASLDIPTDDRPGAPTLRVTISIGVTALARGETYELTDLLAAADSAMYAAKQAGRNLVAFAPPLHDMGLDAPWSPDPDAASARHGYSARASAPQPAGTPLGNSPLSGHRVVLVQTEQTAASLCPRR
jgi:diguanylate cyclase (GGDEF)-like protein